MQEHTFSRMDSFHYQLSTQRSHHLNPAEISGISQKGFTCVRVLYSHSVGWFDLIKRAVLLASWRNGWSSGKCRDSKGLQCCFKKVGQWFLNKCNYKQMLKWVQISSTRLLQRWFKCFAPSVYLWKTLIKWSRNLAFALWLCYFQKETAPTLAS